MADEESPEESEKKIDSLSHPEVMALFGEKIWGTLWKIHSLYIYIYNFITGGPSSRLEKANDEFMNASRVV